jgi:serine/threonine-protein kinase
MTPELWERLKPLFDATVEKPPGERRAFIARVCRNDDELRRELIALIESHEAQSSSEDNIARNIQGLATTDLPTFLPGEVVLGRFRIARRVGSGGMGDVYEASDMELSQTIALKTLRPEIARNADTLSRFKKEVQLARRISGINVCRIHELFVIPGAGTTPKNAFLTMEYLDGLTLGDKISQDGPFSWRDAEAIATEICAGLSMIHESGIIHRDLKSRNIMLADRGGSRRAVLMDFGLAREISAPASDAKTGLTVPGLIMGTPEYMAPEQFEGKDVCPATDIYAMGVVLYELVTGKHPFAAATPLGAAVLRARRPEPASSVQKGLPHRWDHVIGKCLEYDPKRRYQSANELAQALQGNVLRLDTLKRSWFKAFVAGVSPLIILTCLLLVPALRERLRGILLSSHEKHIAVLPFEITGDNQETLALGDGLMDSLSGKISNLDSTNESLWVVPASEVRRRRVSDPSAALREFGATIVVKGTFELHDQQTRLRLTIIDPKRTREIGYVDIDSRSGDLASMQDEAVRRLGRLMNISVRDYDSKRMGDEPATRAAYEDYLAGLGYFQRYDKPGNIDLAITSLQSALNTDPRFALGYARLAQVYTSKYLLTSDPQWLSQAELYGRRAAELDDRVPSTYVALGQVHDLTGNHDLAIQEFQKAISLDPRDSEALSGLATSFKNAGRNTEAEAAYIRAAALRPNDWKGYNDLGIFYEGIGRPKDAISQFDRAIALTPDNAWPYANLGIAYMDFDDPIMLDNADKALTRSIAISPTFAAYANLGFLYAQQHRFAESVAATKAALKLNSQNYDLWDNLTAAYEWIKDDKDASIAREKTIELLVEKAKMNPQNVGVQAKLAALYAKNHANEKAVDKINIALALSPDNQYVLSQIADAYELLGDREKAIQVLQKAVKKGLSKAALNEDPEIQYLIHDPQFKIPGS